MSRATDSAISIRRRLLIFLLPPLMALMLAGVFVNYRAATLFVRSAYDQRLADAAVALSSRTVPARFSREATSSMTATSVFSRISRLPPS